MNLGANFTYVHTYICYLLLHQKFQEIDTALVKLLAESKSSTYLIELITAHDKRVSLDECVEALEANSVRHYFIASV